MTDAKKPAPGQDVYPGDEVFFDHRAGPLSGRVLAHGRHGCTVDVAGKRHKVEWERVLGHKKRAKLDVRVLDHGEDGMVVEDASGRRRFIGVEPAEAPQRIPAKPRPTVKPAPAEPTVAVEPRKPTVRENPDTVRPAPELRKSEYFPKILLWSRQA